MSQPRYFLAKSGETFGPFTLGEIECLRETGEYQRYSWLWDPTRAGTGWQPVDPPPPAPPLLEGTPGEASPEARGASPRAAPALSPPVKGISALAHDSRRLLAGELTQVTESGCELIGGSDEDAPAFSTGACLRLQLADPGGRSMTVSARVGKVARRAGHWRYQLFWRRYPAILKGGQAPASRESISNPDP